MSHVVYNEPTSFGADAYRYYRAFCRFAQTRFERVAPTSTLANATMSALTDQANVFPVEIESEAKGRSKKNTELKPCERCRSQHLKCVYDEDDSTCKRCDKSGHECVRSSKRIRFRDVPASRFRTTKKNNRIDPARKKIKPMDEDAQNLKQKPELDRPRRAEDGEVNEPKRNSATYSDIAVSQSLDVTTSEDTSASDIVIGDIGLQTFNGHRDDDLVAIPIQTHSFPDSDPVKLMPTPSEDRFSLSVGHDAAVFSRILGSDRASTLSLTGSPQSRRRRSSTSRYLDSIIKPSSRGISHSLHDYIENALTRYFRQELAPWFDLCDPDHHFANVVPQKAREPGPLRSALLTISARNLSRNKRFHNSEGVVEFEGRPLPNLSENFAVPYHNECIRDLLQLSMDPRKLHDETLLAAILMLRTDEEMGFQSGDEEEDPQLFLRIASVFIDAQLPVALALPHSSPEVFPASMIEEFNAPSPSIHTEDLGASGLRQACFWTAFRQDLHAAFLKQQPVRFPLSRCGIFRQTTPATDAFWANRMVTFCADVLEFSYGSESNDGKVLPSYTNQERWHELRDRELQICALLPTSFEPTFCSEPDLLQGVFPVICYLDPCHVSGTTYVELARMLLEVFNPTRPKLGHGFLAATNAFINSTKKILFRLCGIALSNHQHCPPCLINACLGISMFGEYFDDPIEQDALLGVLALMHNQYAYPTKQIAQSLRRAWNSDELERITSASFFDMDMV